MCMLFVFSLASIQTGPSAETVCALLRKSRRASLAPRRGPCGLMSDTWMFQGGSILSLPPLFQALSAAHSIRWQNAA